jgi:hypothetical protein
MLIALGAVLAFAVSFQVVGIDITSVGAILIIVGIMGLVISGLTIAGYAPWSANNGTAQANQTRVVAQTPPAAPNQPAAPSTPAQPAAATSPVMAPQTSVVVVGTPVPAPVEATPAAAPAAPPVTVAGN